MKQKELKELLLCACDNPEHQMIFRGVEGDDGVYVTFHLVKLPLFQRLKSAIKYLFGHTSTYGDFDEMILTKEHINSLKRVIKWLNTNHNSLK